MADDKLNIIIVDDHEFFRNGSEDGYQPVEVC